MKRSNLLAAAAALLMAVVFCGAAFASQPAARVDVYPRGALVQMTLEAVPDMEIELPSTLNPDSVLVTGVGNVKVTGFEVREVLRTGWVPPSLTPLADEVEKAYAQVALLASRSASIAQAVKHLEEAVPSGLKGAELEAYIDTALKKRETLELRASETKVLLDKARKEYAALKEDFDRRFPGTPDRILLVSAQTEGKGKITVEAWTDSASWRPIYKMGLDSSSGKISGVYGVEVSQKSGIDWDGEIVFHTVRPRGGIHIPEMRPLVVDFYEPRPVAKMLMTEAVSLAPMEDRAAGEAFMEEGLTDVSIRTSSLVYGFGDSVEIDAGEFSEKSEVSLVSIPEFSPEAWTVAKVEALGRALLPGEARLSVDGRETGTTMIPARSMGQDLEVPFGTTPLVTAKREEMLPTTGTSWIIKGKHQRGYIITVSNGLAEAVTVRVMDRIPVPAQDSIKIQDVAISPEPVEKDEKGFLTWEVKLEKGQSSEISLKYTVSYPSDKELIFR